jgi:thiol-disulfide isomerase/thioredoxin
MTVIHSVFSGLLASASIALLLLVSPASAQDAAPEQGISFAAIQPSVLEAIPEISYLNEKGEPLTLSTEKHKLTILHFWATWCVPCVVELPEVDKAVKRLGSKKLQVLALSLDGKNSAKVREFYKANDIKTLSVAMDSDLSAFQSMRSRGLPTTVFINAKGQEIARVEGSLDWDDETTTDFIKDKLK